MLRGVVYFAHPYRRVKSIRHFLAATAAANDARQDVSPVDRALILVSAGVAYRLVGQPDRAVRAGASAWRQLMQLSDEQRDAVPMMTAIFARSEEHTSELQSLMRISYAVFCLQKKT